MKKPGSKGDVKGKGAWRILYVSKSNESKRAQGMLRSKGIEFDSMSSSRRKDIRAPDLLAPEGRFSGLRDIQWYADRYGQKDKPSLKKLK